MTHADGEGGLEAFVALIARLAGANGGGKAGTRRFIAELGSECAGIHGENMLRHPYRFLREMEGNPPVRFGTDGFAPEVVDDLNPARHYAAFVVVGYWLPRLLAVLVLYAWEAASFVRYKGQWSPNDMNSGFIGIEHGCAVAQEGSQVLPALAWRDLGRDSDGAPH